MALAKKFMAVYIMQKEPFGPISYGAVLRGLVLAERVKQGRITDGKQVSVKAGSYIIMMMMGVALFKRELARDLNHEPRSLGLLKASTDQQRPGSGWSGSNRGSVQSGSTLISTGSTRHGSKQIQ